MDLSPLKLINLLIYCYVFNFLSLLWSVSCCSPEKIYSYSTYCQEVKSSELLQNRKQLYFTWQVREVIKRPKQSQKSMLFIDP